MSAPILTLAHYAGELIPVGGAIDPASEGDDWVLAVRPCGCTPANWTNNLPAIATPVDGEFTFDINTSGWPEGAYHFNVWRDSPDPMVLLDIRLTILGCGC